MDNEPEDEATASGTSESLNSFAYQFEPSTENNLRLQQQLRRQEQILVDREIYNSVMDERLNRERLNGPVTWCTCHSGDGRNNCSSNHKLPKLCFCCQEAATKPTILGHNYQQKIGVHNCIILHEEFNRRALDHVVIKGWIDLLRRRRRKPGQVVTLGAYKNEEFRYAAYTSVTLWIHGELGPKRRAPLSSCIVSAIRRQFPCDDDDDYHDYKSVSESDDDDDDDDFDL